MDKNRTNTQQYNHPNQKDLRRQLRKGGEAPEAVLWTLLKNRQIEGMKFRRQFGVGPYILDFYCSKAQLAVELDGGQHYSDQAISKDDERTAFLLSKGIKVLRFSNREVDENFDGVCATILNSINQNKENL